MSQELLKRILFSIVAIPAAILVLYSGDWALAGMLAILAALGAWEFFRIAEQAGYAPLEMIGIPVAGLIPIVAHAHTLGLWTAPLALALVIVAALATVTLWTRWPGGKPLGAMSVTVFGVLYTGGCFAFAYLLRHHPYGVGDRAGAALVLLPFILTWASDTFAYFTGRLFGRKKLMPAVSPGKTVAGAIGALVATMLISWAFVVYVLGPQAQLTMRVEAALLFGLAISVAVQLGDLVESMLKREANVKDSSTLLPGHGGILDRFDGLLFALPVAYLLYGILLIPAPR